MNKVLVLDTSVLCVWLRVPGKESCGPDANRLTFDLVDKKITEEIDAGTTLVLPFAVIVETGNHIAQSKDVGTKYALVNRFADYIENTIDAKSPWATFSNENKSYSDDGFKSIVEHWRQSAISGQSFGDAMIVKVAEYYSRYNATVEIFTGDGGLKAYEPKPAPSIGNMKRKIQPRRRK